MRGLVTYQRACIGRAVVGDGRGSILSHHVDIEIHQPLASNGWGSCAHPVGGVAYRTGEAVLGHMQTVLREAGSSG